MVEPQGLLQPILEFLRQYAPFDRMTTSHVEFLAKHLRLGFYAKGEIITEPGATSAHTLYIVKQGLVRDATHNPSHEFGPGECFPVDSLLTRRPVTTTKHAAHDTFCFELSWESFETLIAQSQVFRSFCLSCQSHSAACVR